MPKQRTGKIAEIAAIKTAPVGVPIDPSRERFNWDTNFAVVLAARQACEMSPTQVGATVEKMMGKGLMPEGILEPYDDTAAYLESAVAILKAAQARLIVGMAQVCEAT